MDRVIFHIDGNNFFASCECILRPELRSVPMAVAGDASSRHGIILAKNQLAKQRNVQTAEPIWQAQRKCPDLVLITPTRGLYSSVSHSMNKIFLQYTDLVELASIDESYLDVTGSLHLFGGDAVALADRIRAEVREKLGITVSVGVSFCKTFAKLGSDYKKPDATTCFPREKVPELVWPLNVGSMMYVGGRFERELAELNIRTIGDLANCDPDLLRRHFGIRGESAWRCANGDDNEPVHPFDYHREAKSIGNSTTFPRDLVGEREIRMGFTGLAETVSERMRRHGVYCQTVQIQIRDPAFHTVSRQVTLDKSIRLTRELVEQAMLLAGQVWDWNSPVRLLALTAEHLVPEGEQREQLSLFEEADTQTQEKQERLENTISTLRDRFGKGAVQRAGFLDESLGLGKVKTKSEQTDGKTRA